MSEFYLRRMLYPVFACSHPQCFFFGKWHAHAKIKENRSVFSLASNCSDHRKKKAVQSHIQNKGKITNKFNDHIIRYKCLVLTKFTCFS